MICYLIPTCKTCIKQEKLLKAKPNPLINIRYVTMEFAKSTKYNYPLWINGPLKHEGFLNLFGKTPEPTPKLKVPALPRPGGPRNSKPSNIFPAKV